MKDEDQTRKSAPGQKWDRTVDRILTRDEKQDTGTIRVGQRLREIRAGRGLSMRALAEVSGLNVNTLSLIENQHTSPSVSTLQQLAESLNVSMSEFFQTNQGSEKVVYQEAGRRPFTGFEHGRLEDLAVVVGAGVTAADIEAAIVAMAPPWLARVALFDLYQGSQVGAGRRSLAWSLTFQAPDRTLTDAEVNEVFDRIVAEVTKRFDAEVRGT